MYTKQWVNHTIQYSISHISPRPKPHCTSLHLYTLHIPPRLNSLPFTAFSWSSPHFRSLHFTPLIPFQPLFLEILDFLRTSKSLHFTSLHFTSLHFTSLHYSSFHFTSLCKPCSWKYSIFSVLQSPFTSLHFTSLNTIYTTLSLYVICSVNTT